MPELLREGRGDPGEVEGGSGEGDARVSGKRKAVDKPNLAHDADQT